MHSVTIRKLRRRDPRYKRVKRRTERYHKYKAALAYAVYYENAEY